MKKFQVQTVIASFVLFMFMGLTGAHAEKNMKMATADLSRLFDEYYKTQDYNKVLEEKQKGLEKERNAKIEKIQEAQSSLSLLKEDKKADKEKEIEKLKQDFSEYDRTIRADVTKERNDKIRDILLEIEKVVSDFAKKENYTLILNDRVLIYGDKSLDVTEPLIKILNDSKPKK